MPEGNGKGPNHIDPFHRNGVLTPQEANDLETQNVPAIFRKHKIDTEIKLDKRLDADKGGIHEPDLDVINYLDPQKGEPTRELTTEDLKPQSNN